jgi:hypothetical protein
VRRGAAAVVVDVVVVATVVAAAFVVVTAGRVVAATTVVVTSVLTGDVGVVTATVLDGGTALGPVAIGSVAGSATSFAEAIPPNPSTANVVSSRTRRSTDPR